MARDLDLQLLADIGCSVTRCFELCARTLIAQPDEIAREWTMIHGQTPHSWLASRDGTRIYDTLLGSYFSAPEYMRFYGCIKQRRHDRTATARLVASHGNFGPWHR